MKRYSLKALLSAALAVGMLAATASAAPATPGLATESGPQTSTFSYTVDDRTAAPVVVWGTVKEIEEGRLYLENSNESDPYSKIFVNLNEDTLILDANTGAAKTAAELKKDQTVYAYVGPAMTRSMPPIANATLVLCNIPADYAVPTYSEVERVDIGADGKVSLLTNRDVILHLNQDTKLSTYGVTPATPAMAEDTAMAPEGIRPGSKVLAWYSVMTLSLPAQATPSKVLVFPYEYEGYVKLGDNGITVDGDMRVAGIVEDGKLLLPLRAVAETTGWGVTWDNAKQAVNVTKGDKTVYSVTVGGEAATVGEGGRALVVAPKLVDGATYMALDDLLVLHHLKLSQ